jgi:beta-barrel assembly-enhancing protease
MKKVLLQGLILIGLFITTWILLSKVDWVTTFEVKKLTDKTEEKLGKIFFDIVQKSENEIKDIHVTNTIDSLLNKICKANKIDRALIKLHIVRSEDINAFALPNGHLVVYTGLIIAAENPEELCGVIAHELAHISLNHVMKKLLKEIGLNALISVSTGKGGTDMAKEAVRILSSTAFDRGLEKDADIKAVEYLLIAKINPEPFAHFLYNLSGKEPSVMKYFTWASTHPDSKERANYIIEYHKGKKVAYEPILAPVSWETLQKRLKP